jgi:hypothetical protein
MRVRGGTRFSWDRQELHMPSGIFDYTALKLPSHLCKSRCRLSNLVLLACTLLITFSGAGLNSLLPRGMYAESTGAHTVAHPITRNEIHRWKLYEPDNAFRPIFRHERPCGSRGMQARTNTRWTLWPKRPSIFRTPSELDANKHADQKMEITDAREAVERAEDARITTLRKEAAEREQNTMIVKVKAQADAVQSEQHAAESKLQAQQSQQQAEQAKLDTEPAQAAKAQADEARAQADAPGRHP